MRSTLIQHSYLVRSLISIFAQRRAQDVVRKVSPYLPTKARIIEIGAGTCNVSRILMSKGFVVVPIDKVNLSVVAGINPVLCDGSALPFRDRSFEIASLLDVLHHVQRPERVLAEAKRVADRLIVMEPIYSGATSKLFTMAIDCMLNLEFIPPPHKRHCSKDSGSCVSPTRLVQGLSGLIPAFAT